jgi:hypothetical protein
VLGPTTRDGSRASPKKFTEQGVTN